MTESRPRPLETRRLVRAWIWFWYNDITRTCVLMGLHLPFVLLGSYALFGPGEYLRNVAIGAYLAVFFWAMVDNDYTQLERIGLTVYRKPLRRPETPAAS